MPFFVLVNNRAQTEVIDLNRPLFRIGRRSKICDYVLDHPAVSREHLIVRLDGATTLVADNHTRNGTFVNGEALVGEREIADGDVIMICGIALEFHAAVPINQPAQ